MEVRNSRQGSAPTRGTAACFGRSAVNSCCLSLVLSNRFHLWAAGQMLGELWDTGLLIFPLLPTFQKGAGPSHLRLKRQHMWCLPSSSRLPPMEQRGSKALAGEETDGVSCQWNQRLLFPLPSLGLAEPRPPLDLVGCRGYCGRGYSHLE